MPDVCLVIPCYNEEQRLPRAELIAFVDSHPGVSLCLVDDGSRDGTLRLLQAMQAQRPGRVLVLPVQPNGGKAEAVRAGVRYAAASGDWPYIGYWDADLSTPLSEMERLLDTLRTTTACRIAMGSRVKRLGSRIDRRIARHVLGRIFAACASLVLGLSVYDSQCGAKLFRRDTVDIFFGKPFLTRWLFDLEMLVRLRNAGGTAAMDTACEVPLGRWTEVGGSKLRMREMLGVPIELLRIRGHYNKGG
jgi:dolichyl-phosphate beta-glucosyltransferase